MNKNGFVRWGNKRPRFNTQKKNLDITKRIRQKALNEDDERASSLGEGLKLKPKAF